MSKTASSNYKAGSKDPYIAGTLAWLIPGMGHLYLGLRGRCAVFFFAINLTFWGGMVIGGLRSTVDPHTNTAWFFAQIFAGLNTVISFMLSDLTAAMPSYGKTLDLAIIYTSVAGLLNVLVIFDAMIRAQFSPAPVQDSTPSQ